MIARAGLRNYGQGCLRQRCIARTGTYAAPWLESSTNRLIFYGGNMPASVGKRYVAQSGAEVIVTKGGAGELSDGEVSLILKDEG